MSFVSRQRTLSEYPLKSLNKRGGSLPWEIAKALAPIALSAANPIATAVGERVGRWISPSRKEGNGYRLAGMGMKGGKRRGRSAKRSKSKVTVYTDSKYRSIHSPSRTRSRSRLRSMSGGRRKRRSSSRRSRSRSRNRSRSASRSRSMSGGRRRRSASRRRRSISRSSSYKKRY